MTDPYNPLDKINLGKSVAEALLARPAEALADLAPFEGAGIYVLYYRGDFPAYRALAEANAADARWPIYIGKAIPSGGRKGASLAASARGTSLYKRLDDHRGSILDVERASGSLKIADFQLRYLIVDDIWIPLGESLLIAKFKPIWNVVLDGFGNHDPGRGRYNGLRPLWDHLHRGRDWADRCMPREEVEADVFTRIEDYMRAHPLEAD